MSDDIEEIKEMIYNQTNVLRNNKWKDLLDYNTFINWWYTFIWSVDYDYEIFNDIQMAVTSLINNTNERIDQVLDDMEDIKFHCDMRYCNWEECKQQVKQSILTRMK